MIDGWGGEQPNLRAVPIGKRDEENNVVHVHGEVTAPFISGGLTYSQIFVNIKYRQYRGAVKFHIKTPSGVPAGMQKYDCDHAVSTARLEKIWPDAWVNIILVESGLNRSIGSMLEKEDIYVERDQTRIHINAECVLKTFLRRGGALVRSEARTYLEQARKRFISLPKGSREFPMDKLEMALYEMVAADNASSYFAEFARELGVDELNEGTSMIVVSYGDMPLDNITE